MFARIAFVAGCLALAAPVHAQTATESSRPPPHEHNGYRLAETADGFQLVEHGVWDSPQISAVQASARVRSPESLFAEPRSEGQARLSAFATEIPALAIALTQGDVRLDALADGSARITGSVQSGEGTLRVDGTLGWQGDDTPLVLNVTGDNVLASDTRDLHAVIDPELTVRYRAGQPLNVTGTVGVPEARVDLERLDGGVSASGVGIDRVEHHLGIVRHEEGRHRRVGRR